MQHRRREPAPGIFRLVLPFPVAGIHNVNAYLLVDDDGVTLVDCGTLLASEGGATEWGDLDKALEACDVSRADIARLVITHAHIDHYGMAARVVDDTGCELWMHEGSSDELEFYSDPQGATTKVRAMLADHGVPADDIVELTAYEDWSAFLSGVVEPTRRVTGGETLRAADRTWTLVYTPGHSPSHVCLWAEQDGSLISGDHLLGAITPHIDFRRGGRADPLGEYLGSLSKIEELEPSLVLPGHGRPFEDGATRARTIGRHHDRRLGAIQQVIRRAPHTASEITEEIFGTTLMHYQRRLALGETLAHLAYLRRRGEVEQVRHDDGTFAYIKTTRRHAAQEQDSSGEPA